MFGISKLSIFDKQFYIFCVLYFFALIVPKQLKTSEKKIFVFAKFGRVYLFFNRFFSLRFICFLNTLFDGLYFKYKIYFGWKNTHKIFKDIWIISKWLSVWRFYVRISIQDLFFIFGFDHPSNFYGYHHLSYDILVDSLSN
jgi:hypothetical protein